jgi:hypothetical protein
LHIIGEGRLILGGYLNFTVNRREICGELARVDKQANYFIHQLEVIRLINVDPISMKPTWYNNKSNRDSVLKRLDYFSVSDSLPH